MSGPELTIFIYFTVPVTSFGYIFFQIKHLLWSDIMHYATRESDKIPPFVF